MSKSMNESSYVSVCFHRLVSSLKLLTNFHRLLSRKRLDPLEAYIPAVILTEFQIKELGNLLYVFLMRN